MFRPRYSSRIFSRASSTKPKWEYKPGASVRPRPKDLPPLEQPEPSVDTPPPPPLKPGLFKRSIRWTWAVTKISVSMAVIGHVILTHGFSLSPSDGPSMMPTLATSEWLITSKLYRRGRNVQVGDVVSFNHPVKGYKVVKRVLGMPGDFVLRDTPGKGEGIMLQVPEGHCWVVGDNLPWSLDSRHFGPVPLALVRGKIIATAMPFRWIRNNIEPVEVTQNST